MPPAPPVVPALAWLGTWSKPPDRPAQVALGAAVALLLVAAAPGGTRWLAQTLDFASVADLTRRRRFLTVMAFVAAFLSLGYLAFYLRGGPRAPDAATYWLQGRAFSHGHLSWAVPDPSASFRAKDLLFGAPDRVAGIFAPGYALLLAPAFLVGAPMLVGPLVAAALVVSTWLVAREIALASGQSADRSETVARFAVGLSVLSAAIRYHTADALPYGAAAAAASMALGTALLAARTRDGRLFGVAGLAVGFLAATQPVAAVPAGALVLYLAAAAAAAAAPGEARGRPVLWACLAALPGVLFLLAADRAATGKAFLSPVTVYHALFDPHAPLTARELLLGSVRRLRVHLLDVTNFEPVTLLAIVAIALAWRTRGARLAGAMVLAQIVLASPVDPATVTLGAGSKLLVAVVPVEQALVALGLVLAFPRAPGRAAVATFALCCLGFAVHAAPDHERLASGDLGRPRFEPDLAREANVSHGLLFFDDDQGFELAFDPGVPASHGIEAVRLRNDDHDRLLYDSLGHPAIHRYVTTAASASVTFWTPPGNGSDSWRFEAESDWPPVAVVGGRAEAFEPSPPVGCLSEGHALVLTPDGTGNGPQGSEASLTIALPVPRGPTPPERKTWQIIPRVLQRGTGGKGALVLVDALGGPPLARWAWEDTANAASAPSTASAANAAKPPSCLDLPMQTVDLGGDRTRAWLVLRAKGAAVALDKTTVRGH
jgi:hypothetical protein